MKTDVSGRKYEVKAVEVCNRLNKCFYSEWIPASEYEQASDYGGK